MNCPCCKNLIGLEQSNFEQKIYRCKNGCSFIAKLNDEICSYTITHNNKTIIGSNHQKNSYTKIFDNYSREFILTLSQFIPISEDQDFSKLIPRLLNIKSFT